jgi:hypothetical protein
MPIVPLDTTNSREYGRRLGKRKTSMSKSPGLLFEDYVLRQFREALGLTEDNSRKIKASGALHGDGDVIAGCYEIEAKQYLSKPGVSVPAKVLRRTRTAARKNGRVPIVVQQCQTGIYAIIELGQFLHDISPTSSP